MSDQANFLLVEPKWEVGDAIYYKPSKRWGIIEDRDVVRGKVFCEIKLVSTNHSLKSFMGDIQNII